jgi:hypothetical protein
LGFLAIGYEYAQCKPAHYELHSHVILYVFIIPVISGSTVISSRQKKASSQDEAEVLENTHKLQVRAWTDEKVH